MIYIRVDGNSEIGMGHVMRCLSIAEAIKEEGKEVTFITACKECAPIIEEKGFKTITLATSYKDMEAEIDIIKELKADVILIDSYQMTDKYVTELRSFAKVVCLDDLGNGNPADMLINYNIYAKEIEYTFSGSSPKLLLGSEYIPLRSEFVKAEPYELKAEPKNIMITTGGSDPLFISDLLLEAFLRNGMLNRKELVYHVVIGPMNKFADELKKKYGKNPQVVLHENVTSMSSIMRECDVIVTATGSTVYEACAIGIPMISFYFVENQRRIAEYFEKNTDVINCGDFSINEKIACYNACDALVRCVIGRDTRRELSEQEKKLVDGNGAKRIAREIIDLGGK